MKIQNTPAAAMARDWPKANKADKAATSAPVPAEVSTETTSGSGRPSAPPGLERVVAKFEALAAEGKTPGQGQALDRVSRNLARYQENQALAGTPPAPAPDTPPAAETPVAEAPVPAAPAIETPVTEAPANEAPATETPAETTTASATLPTPDPPEDSELALLLNSAPDPTTSDANTPGA